MKKGTELGIILAVIVIIVMLGLWRVISTSLLNPSISKFDMSPMTNVNYKSAQYGFSFTYPYGYLLKEKELMSDQKRSYHISLIRKEDDIPITNGEGPRSISVDIYNATSSLSDWIKRPESNFQLGDKTYASTTIHNLPAIRYKWDGLYQGETLAFEYLGNIITFSVTYDSSNDGIKKDFEEILSSVKLSERLLSKEEAIALLQDTYPELKKYPSSNLPPTSIDSESDKDGWNMVFETNGSGVPYLLGAKCYQVKNDKEIILKGEYKFDSKSAYKPLKVDPRDCRPMYQDVADYVMKHISELSVGKETLGGKYYVTNIEISDGNGRVSYEDGHVSHEATFKWKKNIQGGIEVGSFPW